MNTKPLPASPMTLRDLCNLIAAVIHDMGTEGAPSGVVYSGLMGRTSIHDYETAIALLVKLGLVTESVHVLRETAKLAGVFAGRPVNA